MVAMARRRREPPARGGFTAVLKRAVKSQGLLYVHAAALRSQRPLTNVLHARRNRLLARVATRTLVSYDRLVNAYDLAAQIERDGREGAFVECGVWRGGVAALMALVARDASGRRCTHLFDSFEGLPRPTVQDAKDYREADGTEAREAPVLEPIGCYVATADDVSDFLFTRLRLDPDRVLIHKGWFQHTLPAARHRVGPVALLRIDADWYASVKVCLDQMYDNVIEGGYVILDDYGQYPGCRLAFDQFCREARLDVTLRKIDHTGVWFEKPRTVAATSVRTGA